jgi:SpoVK/Ycf46/Vps4 family AAA+-type ATPase
MTTQTPFLPKNVFLAHELFLRAFHLDQQGQWEDAQKTYFKAGKIFTALTKEFPDMSLFYLWAEQARLAINQIKLLDAHKAPSKPKLPPNPSKISDEHTELRQRILTMRIFPNPNLTPADVIGLDRVMEELTDTIFLPLLHPELLSGNIRTPRNVLLFGPPGCGKSHLVRVLTSIADVYTLNVSAASLLSKWFGESQKMIRSLYEVAWSHTPSIIFIDEFDGLFGSASGKDESEASSTMVQIQRELQQYMDGIHTPPENPTVTIAATNFPNSLSDALLRRFDRILYVPPPSPEVIFQLLDYFLKGIHHSLTSIHLQWLSYELRGYTPSEVRKVCEAARLRPYKEVSDKTASSPDPIRSLSLNDFKASIRLMKPLLRKRGKEGVGTIPFLEWNDKHGFPAIQYSIQPWERPGYHPSDDPNPIRLDEV